MVFYSFSALYLGRPRKGQISSVFYGWTGVYNSMEHEIVRSVAAAQKDAQAADALVRQYLPFIKAETAKFLKRIPVEG